MMKKLVGIAVAAMLLVSNAHAAFDTATQTVSATVNAGISISIDAATENVNLVPGTNGTIGNAALTVTSTNPFTIHASADTDATKGADADKLFEYEKGAVNAYVAGGNMLPSPLRVSTGADTPAAITTGAGTLIYTGSAAVTDEAITAILTQDVPAGVVNLPATKEYRMVITYTATTTSV